MIENLLVTIRNRIKLEKEAHPDALVVFRLGDFHECFEDDARWLAKTFELTLTSRRFDDEHIPMAGFPYHQLELYQQLIAERGREANFIDLGGINRPVQRKPVSESRARKVKKDG